MKAMLRFGVKVVHRVAVLVCLLCALAPAFAQAVKDLPRPTDYVSDDAHVMLLAVKDRKRWIETGYGLEGILPDGKVGEIGRQMVPMLRNNDFDGAVTLAVDEISQIIAQDAGVKLQPLTRWGAQQQQPHATAGQIVGGICFLILVVIFLIWAGGHGLLGFLLGMFLGSGRWGGGGWGGGGFGGGGFGGGGGGSGFGGFGGGSTGGGGAGGSW